MRTIAATVCLLLVSRAMSDDGTEATALRAEWKLPSGAAPCVVGFTRQDAPTAIDLTGAGGFYLDEPHAFARLKANGICCAALPRKAKFAFAGLTNGDVWRWDLESGETTRASSGHSSTVACATVSPDGRLVATGS